MSKKNKYRTQSADFFDYFEGKMSGKERNAFERKLQKDLFNEDAAEGFAMVSREEAEQDLAAAGKKIRYRINLRRRIGWYSAAASLAAILVITTIFLTVDQTPSDKDDRIREMNKAMEPTSAIKSSDESSEALAKDEAIAETSEEVLVAGTTDEGIVMEDTEFEEDVMADEELAMEVIETDEDFIDPTQAEAQPVALAQDYDATPTTSKRMAKQAVTKEKTRIRGVVRSSEDSSPLPGANVLVKEATVGTIADMDGNFEILVDETESSTLVATYIGMEQEESPIVSGEPMEFKLDPSNVSLDEVVVVGYGTSATSEPTGSVVDLGQESSDYKNAVPEKGMPYFKTYIDSSMVFPPSEYALNKAVVVLKFYVLPNGRPHNIQILKSPSQAFSDEAQRALTTGPKWTPATRNGAYVDDDLRLRIVFKEEHKR